jgi:hypothetical protein
MEAFMDALTAIVGRAAAPWVGVILLSSPIWLYAAMRMGRGLLRRRAFQEFAAAHQQLKFVGTIPSDARAPYTRSEFVRWGVLLSNVVEGEWDGLPIYLFDVPFRAEPTRWTTILVKVEGTLHRGAGAEGVIAGSTVGQEAMIEMNLDILCVSAQKPLDGPELSTWLSFATALAKVMERDAIASRG